MQNLFCFFPSRHFPTEASSFAGSFLLPPSRRGGLRKEYEGAFSPPIFCGTNLSSRFFAPCSTKPVFLSRPAGILLSVQSLYLNRLCGKYVYVYFLGHSRQKRKLIETAFISAPCPRGHPCALFIAAVLRPCPPAALK